MMLVYGTDSFIEECLSEHTILKNLLPATTTIQWTVLYFYMLYN